ncbi:MAG: hypothetical protein GYA24_11845 [Candidatus Lokiarchaeota archaeon]|nr:hypothetical protein [Candidatus Lokiarchaeota archaeon]
MITTIGHSTGFVITPQIARDLAVAVGDELLVTTRKVIKGGKESPIEIYLRGTIIKSGGKHGGFIIEKAIATHLQLQKGDMITGDITKGNITARS